MTVTGRRLRNVAAGLVAVLLAAGAAVGEDDHFPFGPFRMYATATKTTGAVSFPMIEGVTTEGEEIRFLSRQFGLRRADLEGQLRMAEDPESLLADLARAYPRFQPDGPPLAELRFVRISRHIDGGSVVDRTERVFATYELEPRS